MNVGEANALLSSYGNQRFNQRRIRENSEEIKKIASEFFNSKAGPHLQIKNKLKLQIV